MDNSRSGGLAEQFTFLVTLVGRSPVSKNEVNEGRLNAFFNTLSDELRACPSVRREARDRLLLRMRKRAGFVNHDLDSKAKLKFLKINSDLKDFKATLDEDVESNAKYFIKVNLERYFSRLSDLNIQVDLDTNVLYDHWRFGPGASNGVKGTHTAEKIVQDMTCTTLCEPYVKRLRASNIYLRTRDSSNEGSGVTLIYGSRLTTVPKNEDTVRTIAIEPSGNMAMQLAAGRILEEVLKSIGCDISTQQEKNKLLAKEGSVTNGLATIDLSSASDMFSLDLVRRLLPPKWFKLLCDIRSPAIMVDGELVQLNMISTMGNGFTFPLMTLCLVSLIYGLRCKKRGPNLFIDWSRTAVFGDDIIVPVDEYSDLCKVLVDAGLVVNHDKSYSDGPFRESCGGDYDKGVDITPFYARDLHYDSQIYTVINQLLAWSARNKFFACDSLKLLVSFLRKGPFFVPEWLNPDQGILSAQVSRRYSRLEVTSDVQVLKDKHFEMPLFVGGYVYDGGSDLLCYTRRCKNPTYKVRMARLPRGYLDGSDPVKRSVADSSFISMLLALMI